MTARFARKSFAALLTGAALLCTLAGAQASLAAQQVLTQPNAVRQALAQAGQQPPAKVSVPQGQTQRRANNPLPAPKPAAKPIVKPVAKPITQAPIAKPITKTIAKPGVKPIVPPAAKPGAKLAKAEAKPGATATAPAHDLVARRDPFSPLVGGPSSTGGAPAHLPPGKAGLVVSNLTVDGIIKGPGGMIAVVTNGQQRTYFLREGDQLYDGSVLHITLTDVSFHETGKDPFGKPVEREVSKPLNATPGEQQ